MKSRTLSLRNVLLALVAALTLVLGPITTTLASGGPEYSYGDAYGYVYRYYKQRTVTYPPSAGPEVAFKQDTGPGTLSLGTHNCYGTDYDEYDQAPGVWRAVGYYSSPATFCVYSDSTLGQTGSFDGLIAWD